MKIAYCVVRSGINKNGEPYSAVARVVTNAEKGSSWLDLTDKEGRSRLEYLDEIYTAGSLVYIDKTISVGK